MDADIAVVEYVQDIPIIVEAEERLSFFEESIPLEVDEIEQQLKQLLNHDIQSAADLEQFLDAEKEVMERISEGLAGYRIAFSRFTDDETIQESVAYHQEEIMPMLQRYQSLLHRKFMNSPYIDKLDDTVYGRLIRSRENALALYREENIPLFVEEAKRSNAYAQIIGDITVEWDDAEKTIPQMREYLQHDDRDVRQAAWEAIHDEVLERAPKLQQLMSELIDIRHQIAENAGFDNYRDYIFARQERTDYTVADLDEFYHSVKEHIVPLITHMQENHRQSLGVDEYRPWDTAAIATDAKRLKPFETMDELVDGVLHILQQLDPQFSQLLARMNEEGLLDLESRSGKAPGGFCSYLPVSGLSFILMNASGTHDDLVTLLHESGHSIHNELMKQANILDHYKHAPKELAELASMSMELLTMDQWGYFYAEEDVLRAKRGQLTGSLSFFPWAMVIDQFQHWMYENPHHSEEQRNAKFLSLIDEMSHHGVDMDGLEEYMEVRWLLQPHLFEAPFYYIEYAIAQLGALQVWEQYEQEPATAMQQFKEALALGSSRSLPEIFQVAGIDFDFSDETIEQTVEFVLRSLKAMKPYEEESEVQGRIMY